MTREMGKPIFETRGDVQEGIDTAFYACGEGCRLFGKTVPSELPNKFDMTMRMPMGVAGLITPWNFPMAIPTWKIFPALMCGNTVVIKPAEITPLSVWNLVECLLDAGFPPEVINVVFGSGSKVGNAIVEHPDVRCISFTGSNGVGRKIAAMAAPHAQARLAGTGRQELHDHLQRRQPRPRRRRLRLGRLRHHRPALHRHLPPHRRGRHPRRIRGEVRRGRQEAEASATATMPTSTMGPAVSEVAAQDRPRLHRDRQGRRRDAGARRQAQDRRRIQERLVHRADDLHRRDARRCASRRKRSSARWSP